MDVFVADLYQLMRLVACYPIEIPYEQHFNWKHARCSKWLVMGSKSPE